MISAAFTDYYELTMSQGYYSRGMDRPAVFECFFRHHPFGGGYSVFAGLGPLLEDLENLRFLPEDLVYLESLGAFSAEFLGYLESFRFRGDVWSVPEGEVVFPREPLLRVRGGLIECQIVEGLVLNRINFQSLVASKTARIRHAARGGSIMEFGLRRAQGQDGAASATRASYIGGAAGTSNVLAARLYGIPAMGTMAHSWIMAFPSEKEAFEAYADLYPDST
ncbi:MAG TPA: nicotinate phosphoribosyltransferase, partial [Magnetospirillaceae bacterium]|nr:nicotinate phosphoribosyltransferase [Magnetospirillaceae bacterium]